MSNNIERPYSPPIGEREQAEGDEVKQEGANGDTRENKEEVELIFDPVLNCYYDYRTHTYYELKNWFPILVMIAYIHISYWLINY